MKLIKKCRFFAILSIVAFTPLESSAGKSWEKVDEERSTILFNYDRESLSSIYFSLKDWDDAYHVRAFYAGTERPKKLGLTNNLGIWHYELGGGRHYQTNYNLRDGLPKWTNFKDRENIISDEGKIRSALSSFDFLMFKSNGVPCSLFSSTFGTDTFHMGTFAGTTRVIGYLCVEENELLSRKTIENLINAIGLKGHNGPSQRKFSLLSAASSSPKLSDTQKPTEGPLTNQISKKATTTTKESELKEAKDLFSNGLISEIEYKAVKKKILDLD